MIRRLVFLLFLASTAALADPVPLALDRTPLEAVTVNGEKVHLFPNGRWAFTDSAKAAAAQGVEWEPGSATFEYPNHGRAATIWYHDHALGMTRLNVYAGPAGFFIIRGGADGDESVLDSRTDKQAVLPGPAPKASDPFPPDKTYYEIPTSVESVPQ